MASCSVESLFLKYASYPSPQLITGLECILQGKSRDCPAPVKCTKRLYSNVVRQVEAMISHKQYDNLCVMFNALRYIAKAWCSSVCLVTGSQELSWNKAADDLLFTLTVMISFSEEAKKSMMILLPMLLQCISSEELPGTAKIEATRGSNSLLEMCDVKYKNNLTKKADIKSLIGRMGELVQQAGDFELQVTMLECLFRLTTTSERSILSNWWFKGRPSILAAFNAIRESLFEVDCRKFLNLLNESSGSDRTVHSIPCKKVFLGSLELQQPKDEGLDQFWVDFNSSTSSLSLYAEEIISDGKPQNDGMWESIGIKKENVNRWNVTNEAACSSWLAMEVADAAAYKLLAGKLLLENSQESLLQKLTANGTELLLSITLSKACSLLSSLPSSTFKEVSITFDVDFNPTLPLCKIFGNASHQPTSRPSTRYRNQCTKQSMAAMPIHINKDSETISPIETLPNTGEHVLSQNSTPSHPATSIPSHPATSTPKRPPLSAHRVPSSSGCRRPPLEFVSSSGGTKASQAISSIVLDKGNKVVQARTHMAKDLVAKPRTIPICTGSKEAKASQVKNAVKSNHKSATTDQSCPTKGRNTGRYKCKGEEETSLAKESPCFNDTSYLLPNRQGLPGLTFKKAQSTTPNPSPLVDDVYTNFADDNLEKQQDPSPANLYTEPLKPSPPATTKQLNSSTGSNVSKASHLALSDISTTCLNRSGQTRTFNLSAVPKPKKKTTRKGKKAPQSSSNCSSLNSTAISERELLAIPDSMPTKTAQDTKPTTGNTATRRGLRKRTTVADPEDSDSSWEATPTKQTKPNVQLKGKVKSKPPNASKKAKPKAVLTGARTRKRPYANAKAHFSSFDLSESDLEQETAAKAKRVVEARKRRRRNVDQLSPESLIFRELKLKHLPPELHPTTEPPELHPTTTESEKQSVKQKNESVNVSPVDQSIATTATSKRKKRVIDELYDFPPQPVSPAVGLEVPKVPVSTGQNHLASPQPLSPLASNPNKESVHKNKSNEISGKRWQSRVEMETTPQRATNNLSKRSGKPWFLQDLDHDTTARSLIKEFEEEEKLQGKSRREVYCSEITPKSPIQPQYHLDQVPPAPKKKRPRRRSSGYFSSYYSTHQSDSEESNHSSIKYSPQPTVSPRSPQVQADEDITGGFAEICHHLVAQSGRKAANKNVPMTIQSEKEPKASESKREEREIRNRIQSSDVTLTQVSRDIVNSRKKMKSLPREWVQPQAENDAGKMKCSTGYSNDDLNSSRISDINSESSGSSEAQDSKLATRQSNKRILNCSSEEDNQSVDSEKINTINAEMHSLMAAIGETVKRKMQKRKDTISVMKKRPDEMEELCVEHQQQRGTALQGFEQQLATELEQLEKDLAKNINSEREVTEFLHQQIEALSESRKSQQMRLSRVRSLHTSFHDQFENLEVGQSKEQAVSQDSLRNDMHRLQKKLLADFQKQEVQRIKKSLQAMLMHV